MPTDTTDRPDDTVQGDLTASPSKSAAADETAGSPATKPRSRRKTKSKTKVKTTRTSKKKTTRKKVSSSRASSRTRKATADDVAAGTAKAEADAEAERIAMGDAADDQADQADEAAVEDAPARGRRSRSRKSAASDPMPETEVMAAPEDDDADEATRTEAEADDGFDDASSDDDDAAPRKKRRRRRRKKTGSVSDAESTDGDDEDSEAVATSDDEDDDDDEQRGSRSSGARSSRARDDDSEDDEQDEAGDDQGDSDGGRSRSRRGGGSSDGRNKRGGRRSERGSSSEVQSAPPAPLGDEIMVVNDAADDECRIAILEEGHLEELYLERETTATNVGNIYKGRVVNVEPAIQAAFIDYGEGANGFLHISDLHPRYFPGKGSTEKVGKKTPRRERPAIQDALKRGQEVQVQVLKEGIGSKGPTLTSYISIPGRLLVMMPDMDRVGVSRKVEDDDARREMRKILDAIDLPEDFGFILRTAGIGRTKTEIKRDVAYLTRLWKQIDKRIEKVGAPCPLYTESDIVIRTVRDVLRPSIKAIVVDSQSAYERVSAFLRVVAPRSGPQVVRYVRSTPIFHAFGVERQIDLIHSREVPLPSGGALVIDQTEALVAIDVNSGKSRSARDSETNAFRTNCEAVDEIARQLRLRDLGGLIVNDLIDMRHMRHRKAIEDRFRTNLVRDRARTSISRISEFGLVEMTRQRMRPSIKSGHWSDCPTCSGRGDIRTPESLGSDVTRHVALYLDQTRVHRLDIVCSPRVASVLLSRKRRELVSMEDETGKRIDVRVSDDIPIDRVDYYAYDERNADLDLHMFQPRKRPKLDDLEREAADHVDPEEREVDEGTDESGGRRRRRRRRKPAPADATAIALSEGLEEELAAIDKEDALEAEAEARAESKASADRDRDRDRGPESSEDEGEDDGKRRRRRRRRRRGGRGADEDGSERGESVESGDRSPAAAEPAEPSEPMQVFKLARELEITSKELMARGAELGIEIPNHMKKLDGPDVDRIRASYAPPAPEPEPESEVEEAEASGAGNGRGDDGDRDGDGDEERGGRKRRRRRRRRRGGGGDEEGGGDEASAESGGRAEANERSEASNADRNDNGHGDDDDNGGGSGRRRGGRSRGGRSRGGGRGGDGDGGRGGERSSERSGERSGGDRGSRAGTSAEAKPPAAGSGGSDAPGGDTPAPKPRRRALYGAGRRPVSRAAVAESASKSS